MGVITTVTAFFLVTAISAASASDNIPASQDVNAYVTEALANNPEIRASEARWNSYISKARQASSFDDPMLMFKMQNLLVRDPLDTRRDPMTQKVIGISQQIPFWGKRGLKQEMADRESESYQWQLEERKLQLASMVKENWAELYLVDRELEIINSNIRIMDDVISLAQTRYTVGQGTQQDILRAQLERSKMLEMQISLSQSRTSVLAAFNSLLNRPPENNLESIQALPLRPVTSSADALLSQSDSDRPLLKSYRSLQQRSEAGERLARKEYYPDFNLSLEYMQRDRVSSMEPGYDMYSVGVTMNLPVQRERRQAMVSEASADEEMAAAEITSLKNTIRQGITDSLSRLEQEEKLEELYRTGIIPQSEQSVESATIGYRVGKVDFQALLESRIALFNNEKKYHESIAQHAIVRARLEALVGRELE